MSYFLLLLFPNIQPYTKHSTKLGIYVFSYHYTSDMQFISKFLYTIIRGVYGVKFSRVFVPPFIPLANGFKKTPLMSVVNAWMINWLASSVMLLDLIGFVGVAQWKHLWKSLENRGKTVSRSLLDLSSILRSFHLNSGMYLIVLSFLLKKFVLLDFHVGNPTLDQTQQLSKLIKIHWVKAQIEWVDRLLWCVDIPNYNSQGYLSEEEKSQGYLSHFETTRLSIKKKKTQWEPKKHWIINLNHSQ